MTDFVYDIETYKSCFTVYIGNADTRKCYGYEISFRKDDREKMIQLCRHIKKTGGRMVGFNNVGFDWPVMQYILLNQDCTVSDIFDKAQECINAEWSSVKNPLIPQVDLYLVHHFDNKARSTSLKSLEFNMRSDNIEDLPFDPFSDLTPEQIDELLNYNKHDMYQTYLFYNESLEQIRFRDELSEKYGRDFTNHNDTKIGKSYFIMRLEEASPGACYHKGKVRQTKRDSINLKDCILPYIQFKRPEFQAVKDWLERQSITETKGVFKDIQEHSLGDLAQYANMRTKKKKLHGEYNEEELQKEVPESWVQRYDLKSGKVSWYWSWNVADSLNCVVDGLQYDFGTGGLHASMENTIIESNEEKVLVDADVKSYYPNLAIVNRVSPAHLGDTFCDIYEDVYKQRQSYAKGTPENAMMKLALNGVYGDSNNKFSPFYDPKYTMTITVSGQLTLCMLAEELTAIEGLEIIQVNTDGLTYYVPVEKQQEAREGCDNWVQQTGLELEFAEYQKMALRDCNNYLAMDTEGNVKQKGAYQYSGMGWHQNQSMLVVPKAAEAALLYDQDIEEFIHNHDDKMDFMIRAKVPRNFRLVGVRDGQEEPLQNICRYYVSNDGVELVKIMPPLPGKEEERRTGIQVGHKVKVCNDIANYDGDINYDYYVKEAKKLVVDMKEKVC